MAGPANAKIEFSAVDRAAYFVHNSSRLTRNTLWRKMEAYDTGCSRKGGKNAMSVFKVFTEVFHDQTLGDNLKKRV